jgi:hypothetical protein
LIPFSKLSPDIQKLFNYDPQKAAAAEAERQKKEAADDQAFIQAEQVKAEAMQREANAAARYVRVRQKRLLNAVVTTYPNGQMVVLCDSDYRQPESIPADNLTRLGLGISRPRPVETPTTLPLTCAKGTFLLIGYTKPVADGDVINVVAVDTGRIEYVGTDKLHVYEVVPDKYVAPQDK